ncbi:MAG: methyltransferase [Candidatus Omnitrophota bacterium]|nr:class I SAM-dependent methyltransferase [Candidatus Omnitrophota bacterium]
MNLNKIEGSLRTKIKIYTKRACQIEKHLSQKPEEWGKYQSEFNAEVNNVFRDIMYFEKENLVIGKREKTNKLKRLFINKIRDIFMRGIYIKWSLEKPLGYSGDYKIIDGIYQNNPTTTGFDRLFDNYYQMSAICVAVRNRKEDFKKLLVEFINNKNTPLRIMDFACGPCQELKEILTSDIIETKDIIFDCYDREPRALEFSRDLLKRFTNINYFEASALKIARTKEIKSYIDIKYDFIYSTGLFDYLKHKLSINLVRNFRKLLKKNGVLAISNVRDKYSNPSVHFMEWVGNWNLVYRGEEEFKDIFIKAGFKENELKIKYEQQGIIQYMIALNKA